jgi:hypothetical protein
MVRLLFVALLLSAKTLTHVRATTMAGAPAIVNLPKAHGMCQNLDMNFFDCELGSLFFGAGSLLSLDDSKPRRDENKSITSGKEGYISFPVILSAGLLSAMTS